MTKDYVIEVYFDDDTTSRLVIQADSGIGVEGFRSMIAQGMPNLLKTFTGCPEHFDWQWLGKGLAVQVISRPGIN